MQYIKKAMQFNEWFESLKAFLAADQDKLTEKVSVKLGEIVQFVEQYSSIEKVDIEFLSKEKAEGRDKKKNLLK
jgi:Asp-tRNA(Asn)/Glu-tRNA(Gln) amidotransferase C subunit